MLHVPVQGYLRCSRKSRITHDRENRIRHHDRDVLDGSASDCCPHSPAMGLQAEKQP